MKVTDETIVDVVGVEDGLIVPVLCDASRLDLGGIATRWPI